MACQHCAQGFLLCRSAGPSAALWARSFCSPVGLPVLRVLAGPGALVLLTCPLLWAVRALRGTERVCHCLFHSRLPSDSASELRFSPKLHPVTPGRGILPEEEFWEIVRFVCVTTAQHLGLPGSSCTLHVPPLGPGCPHPVPFWTPSQIWTHFPLGSSTVLFPPPEPGRLHCLRGGWVLL